MTVHVSRQTDFHSKEYHVIFPGVERSFRQNLARPLPRAVSLDGCLPVKSGMFIRVNRGAAGRNRGWVITPDRGSR